MKKSIESLEESILICCGAVCLSLSTEPLGIIIGIVLIIAAYHMIKGRASK